MKVKQHDAAAILSELAREPNNLPPKTLSALRCAVACLSGGFCGVCEHIRIDGQADPVVSCAIDGSSIGWHGCCSEWRARDC